MLSIPDATATDFNNISLLVQNEVARHILGDELYNAFSTDYEAGSGTPTEQKWVDFLDGVTWTEVVDENDTTEDIIHNSDGIKDCWKYFVYYEWLQQAPFVSNFTGKKTNLALNGQPLTRQDLNVETHDRYNRGAERYCTVLEWLKYYEDYQVDYTSIVESPAGTYTVNLSDTIYLKSGDEISIDGTRYTTTGVTADTSITFTASAGLTFSNDFIKWYPFEDVALGKKDPIWFNGMI
jgi:hypothetical protein